jgi:ribosomal protein L37AE/L43A
MQKIKLTPDDVLTGAGTYREEVEIDCPVCTEEATVKTDSGMAQCEDCGAEFGVENPFS